MAMIRENFTGFLEIVNKVFDVEMAKKPDYLPMLFNVEKSTRSQETHQGIGNAGLMSLWNGEVDYDVLREGYAKTYRHIKYSKGLPLERELFEDDEFGEIKRRVRKLTDSVYKTRQTHGASVFNNAFTLATGPDSVALCSASHPISPVNASVQNNAGVLALDVGNLDTVMQAMWNFKDDKEQIIGVNPDCLIVGNTYRRTAERIAGSKAEPFVMENTINLDAGIKVVYNPWIQGSKWFVADSMMMKDYLNWYDRRLPAIEQESEFDSEIVKFKVVGRWSFGWDAWQFVYGNEG